MDTQLNNPQEAAAKRRYFLSYTGVKLPLRLVEELPADALHNRNTWFCADYDAQGRLCRIEKRVHGEIAMTHSYEYDEAGVLRRATVHIGDETHCVEAR